MDFRRIQILLIIFFALFNIYLTYQIYEKINTNPQIANIESDQDVQEQLANRGISLEVDLSADRVELPVILSDPNTLTSSQLSDLVYQDAELEDGIIESQFDKAIPLRLDSKVNQKLLEQIQREFIANEDYFLNGHEYQMYQYLPANKQLVFWQKLDDSGPILDQTGEIRLFLNNNYEVEGYRQTYQGNVSVLAEKRVAISKEEALYVLDQRLETHLPADSTILNMDMGYHRFVALDDSNIYFPAWKILYEQPDGTIHAELIDGVKRQVVTR